MKDLANQRLSPKADVKSIPIKGCIHANGAPLRKMKGEKSTRPPALESQKQTMDEDAEEGDEAASNPILAQLAKIPPTRKTRYATH